MKKIERLFQSITQQKLKWKISMYFLMEKVFDVPVKNKEETYEKIIEMTENIWKFFTPL